MKLGDFGIATVLKGSREFMAESVRFQSCCCLLDRSGSCFNFIKLFFWVTTVENLFLHTTSVLKPTVGYWGGGIMVTDAKQFWGLQFMIPLLLCKMNVARNFG